MNTLYQGEGVAKSLLEICPFRKKQALTDELRWLADKIPAFGDYGKDCAAKMYQAANRIEELEHISIGFFSADELIDELKQRMK